MVGRRLVIRLFGSWVGRLLRLGLLRLGSFRSRLRIVRLLRSLGLNLLFPVTRVVSCGFLFVCRRLVLLFVFVVLRLLLMVLRLSGFVLIFRVRRMLFRLMVRLVRWVLCLLCCVLLVFGVVVALMLELAFWC